MKATETTASMPSQKTIALAVVAHPDDVEFMIAGTLLLLKAAGAEIHIWNLANGCMGSAQHGAEETAAIRWAEASASARLCGATLHAPLFNDLGIYYDADSLARVAAVVRRIQPTMVFTHALSDYMEDHQNAARLVATAAFSRSTKNFVTAPPCEPYDEPTALYHALPHGLCGPMGETPAPSHFVAIDGVFARKREMLAQHQSQKVWLDVSQGMHAYLQEMEKNSRTVGLMSGRFALAEGFTKHASTGFASPDFDPLSALLGDRVIRPGDPSNQ